MAEGLGTVGEPCGSGPCREMVDRLGKMMTDQQAEGFKSIKELMTVHHENLKGEIKELKQAHKDQGDEIFPRLRIVEERVRVIEATSLTESKAKEIVADNETVKWTTRRRSFERAVAKGVLIASILAVIGAGIAMYADHQNSKNTQPPASAPAASSSPNIKK